MVVNTARRLGVSCGEFGGYEKAERQVVAFSPPEIQVASETYPLAAVRIDNLARAPLSHRDYLGALMSLGIKRELVGDLAVDDSGCTLFALRQAVRLITDELHTVGRCGVRVSETSCDTAKIATSEPERVTVNVVSLRADCLVAAVLHKNRAFAKELIQSETVSVCGELLTSAARQIAPKSTLIIRGYGKFGIGEISGKSAKDRLFVDIFKY